MDRTNVVPMIGLDPVWIRLWGRYRRQKLFVILFLIIERISSKKKKKKKEKKYAFPLLNLLLMGGDHRIPFLLGWIEDISYPQILSVPFQKAR